MKKLLWVIVGLGLLVYLAQVYEAQSCKDLVKDLNLTGTDPPDIVDIQYLTDIARHRISLCSRFPSQILLVE